MYGAGNILGRRSRIEWKGFRRFLESRNQDGGFGGYGAGGIGED